MYQQDDGYYPPPYRRIRIRSWSRLLTVVVVLCAIVGGAIWLLIEAYGSDEGGFFPGPSVTPSAPPVTAPPTPTPTSTVDPEQNTDDPDPTGEEGGEEPTPSPTADPA